MFCVNIALGNTAWRLLFKEEEKAKAVFDSLKPLPLNTKTIDAEDDFGQVCSITTESVHGLLFEDLDKAKMANVEIFLHQQRVQVMAQKAAEADPALRMSRRGNGIATLDPMNQFRQN